MKKILVIAAHPDDEVLGCGGAISKHVQSGDDVHIIVLADGVTSRVYLPKVPRNKELRKYKDDIAIRRDEFFRAIKIMGIKKQNCYWLGFPDQRLDARPLIDIIKPIEQISKQFMFDLVYTHHWGDLNKDHRVCCEAVFTAFRPSRQIDKKVSIFCFEIPGNMNVLPPKSIYKFRPNHFVDMASCLRVKLKALRAYKSELCDYPRFTSPESVSKLSRDRAKNKKYKYAEAFERVRIIE